MDISKHSVNYERRESLNRWLRGNLLVLSRDYYEAPCADCVPKVSAKKVHVTPTWQKCHFTPPPPPPTHTQNVKLAFLDRSWDSRFKILTSCLCKSSVNRAENKAFELRDLPLLTTYLLLQHKHQINNCFSMRLCMSTSLATS